MKRIATAASTGGDYQHSSSPAVLNIYLPIRCYSQNIFIFAFHTRHLHRTMPQHIKPSEETHLDVSIPQRPMEWMSIYGIQPPLAVRRFICSRNSLLILNPKKMHHHILNLTQGQFKSVHTVTTYL
jgi:hypothetical protein